MPNSIFVDPSLAGPDIRFSTGTVANGAEIFAPVLPELGGGADPDWNLTQWNTPANEILDPAAPDLSGSVVDPLLGAALAAWRSGTATSGSSFTVFGSPTGATFRLGAAGGSTRDTFLQTTGYAPAGVTFDHALVFTARERVAEASVGTGTAIAFNSFTVFFNENGSAAFDAALPSTELFLQVPLCDFRGEPAPFQTVSATDTWQQIYNLSSENAADPGTSDASVDYLAFATDTGALHSVRIDLNQALLRLADTMAAQVEATDPALAAAYRDMSRWSLGSYYGGVETSAGAGGGATSLSIDIADPVVEEDDAATLTAAGLAPSTVQSIDGGAYADRENADTVATLPGTTSTVVLEAGDGLNKTVASLGIDTVSVLGGETVAIHADGPSFGLKGSGPNWVTLDGSAVLSVSGSFDTLSVCSDADADVLGGTVSGQATLVLGGAHDRVALAGTVSASLSGADGVFAASGGTVSLFADGAAIDQSGSGAQLVFLNGHDAAIEQTGTGSQTVVGLAATGGSIRLDGGHGSQTLWTGDADATVTASADPTAVLVLRVQAGSASTVRLGAGSSLVNDQGGAVVVQGGTASGAAATLVDGSGVMTVWGGAERMVASLGAGGTLGIAAGSGAQTVFGGAGTLTVLGSHVDSGTQTVVCGAAPDAAATIFGGRTVQTIWTGQGSDRIVSSVDPGDSNGRITAIIQGGASSYWGGVEDAVLDNTGGTLDAMLGGSGHVEILADMAGRTHTTLHGFANSGDSLVLAGVSDPSQIRVDTVNHDTVLGWSGGASSVTLAGIDHVTLAALSGGVSVSV